MGIEFRESSIVVGPKTNIVLKKGMVFNIHVGLSGLSNKEATDKEGKVNGKVPDDLNLMLIIFNFILINIPDVCSIPW